MASRIDVSEGSTRTRSNTTASIPAFRSALEHPGHRRAAGQIGVGHDQHPAHPPLAHVVPDLADTPGPYLMLEVSIVNAVSRPIDVPPR